MPAISTNGKKSAPRFATSRFAMPRFAMPRSLVTRFARLRRHWHLDWQKSRAEFTVLMLSLIAAALMVPHVLHFEHRNDAERVTWKIPFWRQLEAWEYYLYDARFTARGPVSSPSRDKIAIVGVDENSMAALGSWPFPRRWHAQLIRRLKQAGARVIALDFDFSSRQNPRDDAALVQALREAGNVLLASYLTQARGPDVTGRSVIEYRTVTPLEELDMETPDLGMVWLPRDSDGHVRRYPQRLVINDVQLGSLAALAVAQYEDLLDNEENKRYEQALQTAVWPDAAKVPRRIPYLLSRSANPDAPRARTTPLYFYGPAETFPVYSYAGVLSDQYSMQALHEKFGGRIVFVGATAPFLKDVFIMPNIESGRRKTARGEEFAGMPEEATSAEISGVELHATMAAMLLDGQYLKTASTQFTLAVLFGLTLATGAWIIALRRPVNWLARRSQLLAAQRRRIAPLHSMVWFGCYALLGPLPIFLFWQAAIWAFAHRDFWIIAVYPMTGAALGGLSALLLLFSSETVERRKTATQMGRFMSAGILEEVLARPEEEYPRPRRMRATIFFTDLQGFTPYSESHEPEEVVAALNAYMTRMVPIIIRHGGEIDKYIGDAIMAFFGAPKPRPDHAAQALRCAVAMQEEGARFRNETGIPFYTRIGIHTGDVIAGCMGSEGEETKINYTVIGDTVNLAARLEGKNKDLGSWILCSAATFEAAPGVARGERAHVEVKGKSEVIEAYKVLGLADQPPRSAKWGPVPAGSAEQS